MNLRRFLKNPIHSLQKQVLSFKKKIFIYQTNKHITQLKKLKNPSINLDQIFVDQREIYSNKVEQIKYIGTKILSMIHYLSIKYEFSYFLAYGTLLGAIRHKGYIPWDDDIDIMMSQDDFAKFSSISYELPESIRVFAKDYKFVKVMDKFSKISFDGQRGVAVDIFILDNEASSNYSFINVHTQKRLYLEKEDLFPLHNHPFETFTFSIPQKSDKLLRMIYGDYMVLPPEEKRISHHTNNEHIFIYPFNSNKAIK